MTDEQIIKQIKKYPVLYNASVSQYRDLETRNIAWEEIARKLNSNVEDVKTRWGKLRNCYTNALKRRNKKCGQDTNKILPWKFEKQMEFLLPHLKYRTTNKTDITVTIEGNVKDESLSYFNEEYDSQFERPASPASSIKYVSSIEDDIASYTPTNNKQNRNIIKEFVKVMKTSNDVRDKQVRHIKMDENDYFFLSMSKLIKKLPQEDQTDIKFEIHKLIYEAEKRQMKVNTVY